MLQPTSSYRCQYINFITVRERDGEGLGVPSDELPVHEDVDVDPDSASFVAYAVSKPLKPSLGRVEESSEILGVHSKFWPCVQMPHEHLGHMDLHFQSLIPRRNWVIILSGVS